MFGNFLANSIRRTCKTTNIESLFVMKNKFAENNLRATKFDRTVTETKFFMHFYVGLVFYLREKKNLLLKK